MRAPRTLLAAAVTVATGTWGCGPKAPPSPPTPVVTAPVPSPTPAASPFNPVSDSPPSDLQLAVLPPLAGDLNALDLEALSTVRTTFTIESDQVILPEAGRAALAEALPALESDPRWRVTRDPQGTGLVAWQRDGASGRLTVPAGGYHTGSGGVWRVQLRLSPRGAEHPWQQSPLVARNPGDATRLKVAGWRMNMAPWQGWQAAAFTLDGPGFGVEVHELAPTLRLARAGPALADTARMVQRLQAAATRGQPHALSRALLPAGEPSLDAPGLTLTPAGNGYVDVTGRLAPSAPGWTWVRLLDDAEQPIDEARVALLSMERIGADAKGQLGWYLQSQVPAASGVSTIQAWSLPDGAEAPVLLGAWPTRP